LCNGNYFCCTIGFAIYANTGKRFRKEVELNESTIEESQDAKTKEAAKNRLVAMVTISIGVVICVVIGIMFYMGEQEPTVRIHNDSIQISGMYGLSIDFAQVDDISLIERNMGALGVGTRTNGYGGFNGTWKGNFHSIDYGNVLLFVRSRVSPTIHIERGGAPDVFISFNDSGETTALYEEMIAVFSSR